MQASTSGLLALIRHEAVVLTAYQDIAHVWTIGVGHTASAGEPKPAEGMRITLPEAFHLFRNDVRRYAAEVAHAIKISLQQHEFDALVSFHYNTGAIARASLVHKLNEADFSGAAAGLLEWTRAGGKISPGLVNRRQAEKTLFETGDYGDISQVPIYETFPGPRKIVRAAEIMEGLGSSGGSDFFAPPGTENGPDFD